MKYTIKQNLQDALEFIIKNPTVLFPFFIIAFLEGLAIELAYFSLRKPLAFIVAPIVKKFYGEGYTHYPASALLSAEIYDYIQLVVYIFAAVFLTAIAVNIFMNIKHDLPIKPRAMVRNVSKRYLALVGYGLLMVFLLFLARKADMFIFTKLFKPLYNFAPNFSAKLMPFLRTCFFFITNVIIMVFIISTVPLMVLKNSSFPKALLESLRNGVTNFRWLFIIVFVPFIFYLPLALLRSDALKLVYNTFPEANICITALGIPVSMFVDCFIIMAVSQFLLIKEKVKR